MPISQTISEFKQSIGQCESLIANAHKTAPDGAMFLPQLDREQITCAAFLNMFIAWEKFLEQTLKHLMTGSPTINGSLPTKYVSPSSIEFADKMILGVGRRYFDYANHDNMRSMANLFFDSGYPFEPHLSGIFVDLADLKTMRNSCAHISSSTQTALESLALRLFGQPRPGITVYQMLVATDPRSSAGETIFSSFKSKLIVTAELISEG